MNTASELLKRDVPRLVEALSLGASAARLEARLLLGHALAVDQSWLLSHEHEHLPPQAIIQYEAKLKRRLAGEPIAYILGEREFYGRKFRVTPDVLIPRPETELLVDLALARCGAFVFPKILDLGTGSGCIAISLALECPSAQVTAVELSRAALDVARHNAVINQANVEFIQSDWFDALGERRFDIIVANPPYIDRSDPHLHQGDVRYEPACALVADNAGLADIEEIVIRARTHLHPNGVLLLEHGYNQAAQVRARLKKAGYAKPQSWVDLAGIARVSGGKWVQ